MATKVATKKSVPRATASKIAKKPKIMAAAMESETVSMSPAATAPKSVSSGSEAPTEWSWGAFMFNFWFLVGVRRYVYLWWYLLSIIPLVNIIFLIAFHVWLGMKGRQLAFGSSTFANRDEYNGYFKGIDHAGKIMFIVMVVFVALYAIFFATIFSWIGSQMGSS